MLVFVQYHVISIMQLFSSPSCTGNYWNLFKFLFFILQFTCDIPDFANVKKNLESRNIDITRAQLEYIPNSKVELEGTMLEYVQAMYEKLEDNCGVIRIYDNITEKPSS